METDTDNKAQKKTRIIEVLAIIVFVGGLLWIGSLIFNFSGSINTNNAQVDGDMTTVTSRVAGNIREIRFAAYSQVHEGDTLVLLDDSEFKIKVAQAEADLEIAKANLLVVQQSVITSTSTQQASSEKLKGNEANLERAEKNYARFQNMLADSAVTRNQYDQVVAQLKSEQAFLEASKKEVLANESLTMQSQMNIESAKATISRKAADLDAAKLQLSYTVILAPISGTISERTLEKGELVNANQVLATIIQQDKKWVMANFKETQMDEIKIGQKVDIMVDALGDKTYEGIVKDLSPATGAKYSMVAPDNSTGNFVKITQRIPVRIEFVDSGKDLAEIKPGMNVTVEVKK